MLRNNNVLDHLHPVLCEQYLIGYGINPPPLSNTRAATKVLQLRELKGLIGVPLHQQKPEGLISNYYHLYLLKVVQVGP